MEEWHYCGVLGRIKDIETRIGKLRHIITSLQKTRENHGNGQQSRRDTQVISTESIETKILAKLARQGHDVDPEFDEIKKIYIMTPLEHTVPWGPHYHTIDTVYISITGGKEIKIPLLEFFVILAME